jgi:ornithine carbamoyltransferase
MNNATVEVTPASGKHANGTTPYNFTGQHFLNTADLPQEAFLELVERALALKKAGYGSKLLNGTVLGMIFFIL